MATNSLQLWQRFVPTANQTLLSQVDFYLKKYAPQFGLTTPRRLAAFMAQAGHETDNFRTLREYASGAAYEGRRDLGNTQPGDGRRFRGRGIFQTTGRYNYTKKSRQMFGDLRLVNNPEILEQPEWAVLSALHFWRDKKLNELADRNAITQMTRVINGGTNGLQDRLLKWRNLTNLMVSFPAAILTDFVKKKVSSSDYSGRAARLWAATRFFLTGKS
jgi:putative chitinase